MHADALLDEEERRAELPVIAKVLDEGSIGEEVEAPAVGFNGLLQLDNAGDALLIDEYLKEETVAMRGLRLHIEWNESYGWKLAEW